MQIRSLHIENFGKLHDFHMELDGGLQVVCADNGWGKSTLAAFVKAMFYGLDYTTKRSLKENERKKYLPWQGGAFGGSMEFSVENKEYRVERFFGAKDKEDTFALYDRDTGLASEDYSARLGEELFHLDRAAFARSSFFAQQDFAVSVNDSLNAGLTHVEEDAGDMQNYEKASASLEERMKFYQKTGGRGQIPKLEEERRQMLRALEECRSKEAAVGRWRARALELQKRETETSQRIAKLETQVKRVQAYREKAAKREQHDLLKNQAVSREGELQRTAEALAEYVRIPLGEEELDRCREAIYRIHTLRIEEKGETERLRGAQKHREEQRREKDTLPQGGVRFGIVAGLLSAVGAALLLLELYTPGALFLIAGICTVFPALQRERQRKYAARVYEEAVRAGEQELVQIKDACRSVQEKRKKLEEQVQKMLHTPEGAEFEELELCWKLERQKSHDYRMLKQSYESQRREAARSRETYLAFRGKLTEEELTELLTLEKPQGELTELQRELEDCRFRKEQLVREQSDVRHQIRMLTEEAERIPELEEETERIAGELSDAVREHGLLEKTLKYLKTAREQFSTRYLRELQQGFSGYLGALEPQVEVEASLDVRLKAKLREGGAARELEYFSAGWQDLVQLAKRFAIVDALYEKEQPVLILDDPFVNLDAGKTERAIALLKKMSERRQILYFTCRE